MTMPPSDPSAYSSPQPGGRRRAILDPRAILISAVVLALIAAVAISVAKVAGPGGLPPSPPVSDSPPIGTFSHHPVVITLPHNPASYLGAFVKGVPASYAPMETFADSTGVQPNLALYYASWYERFRFGFATQASDHGAVPLIQIEPKGISLAAIADGRFDTFVKTLATDVAAYGERTKQGVIIGFGHEMNGFWYSWGHRGTSPAVFVKAWRHIVDVFRQQGADDVTWLWTVNIIDKHGGILPPRPWWPGSSYVTWVGIDGYYLKPSWTFASLFGPTIRAVRALSPQPHPILISETGAAPVAGKSAKVANLFAGVDAYGLLGFVWFDANGKTQDFRLDTPAVIAAYRRGAQPYDRPAS